MSTERRTIIIDTIDRGLIEVECPTWCTGHGWQIARGIGRNDITHNSVAAKVFVDTRTHGRMRVLNTSVSWAPFVEPVPVMSIETDLIGDFEAEDAAHVARALRIAADRLERVAAAAIRLRDGGTP